MGVFFSDTDGAVWVRFTVSELRELQSVADDGSAHYTAEQAAVIAPVLNRLEDAATSGSAHARAS